MLALNPLVLIMFGTRSSFTPSRLFLPVAIALTFVFALETGLSIATLAIFFVDIADIWGVALTILTYMTLLL